jgi:two-component system nitrogen regulation response regulator GlnG
VRSDSEERVRRELETSTRAALGEVLGDHRSARLPGLTVLWHPDPRRIGERAVLPALTAPGRPVLLSRGQPAFAREGRNSRPLADPYLSRRPLTLEALAGGTLRLGGDTDRLPLTVDGEAVSGERRLAAEDLAAGTLLLLAERVLLLLHAIEIPPPTSAPPLGLVGESAAMEWLRREILRLAPSPLPVLVRGETGTGKELVARALHEQGDRAAGPFVAVNLAALPAALAAAELFGARKGAFTGAAEGRAGLFAAAAGGTLFLDEIGETPPEVQALLLRALDTGEIQPLGADRPRAVDARVVAATDADLERRVAAGTFKAPLLHRLSACSIRIPPLRQRREDLGVLLLHFLRQELQALRAGALLEPEDARRNPWMPAKLVARLARHPWPGNVRQLRNVARHLALGYRDHAEVPAESAWRALRRDLLADLGGEPSAVSPRFRPAARGYRAAGEITDEELAAALAANRWRLMPTAAALGLSRTSLYRRLDACAGLRRASELPADEVRAALARHRGDIEAAAEELRVSPHGLKLRLAAGRSGSE